MHWDQYIALAILTKLFSNRLHIMSWIYPSNAYCSPFCLALSDILPVRQKLLIISLGMSDTGAYILYRRARHESLSGVATVTKEGQA